MIEEKMQNGENHMTEEERAMLSKKLVPLPKLTWCMYHMVRQDDKKTFERVDDKNICVICRNPFDDVAVSMLTGKNRGKNGVAIGKVMKHLLDHHNLSYDTYCKEWECIFQKRKVERTEYWASVQRGDQRRVERIASIHCPHCSTLMQLQDGFAGTAMESHLWECNKCRGIIPQTEKNILHCGCKSRGISYDICRNCESDMGVCQTCHRNYGQPECGACRREKARAQVLPPGVGDLNGNSSAWALADQYGDKAYEARMSRWLETLRAEPSAANAQRALGDISPIGFLLPLVRDHESRCSKESGRLAASLMFEVFTAASRLISRSELAYYFPKSCPGCFVLNCLSLVGMHRELGGPVASLWAEMLQGVALDEFNSRNVQAIAEIMRRKYKRTEDPYPFMGNCLDYSDGVELLVRLGSLLLSDDLAKKDLRHPEAKSSLSKWLETGVAVGIVAECSDLRRR